MVSFWLFQFYKIAALFIINLVGCLWHLYWGRSWVAKSPQVFWKQMRLFSSLFCSGSVGSDSGLITSWAVLRPGTLGSLDFCGIFFISSPVLATFLLFAYFLIRGGELILIPSLNWHLNFMAASTWILLKWFELFKNVSFLQQKQKKCKWDQLYCCISYIKMQYISRGNKRQSNRM